MCEILNKKKRKTRGIPGVLVFSFVVLRRSGVFFPEFLSGQSHFFFCVGGATKLVISRIFEE